MRLQFSLCAPIVPLRDATFLQMTRLLQVTSTIYLNDGIGYIIYIYDGIGYIIYLMMVLAGGPPVAWDGCFGRFLILFTTVNVGRARVCPNF